MFNSFLLQVKRTGNEEDDEWGHVNLVVWRLMQYDNKMANGTGQSYITDYCTYKLYFGWDSFYWISSTGFI